MRDDLVEQGGVLGGESVDEVSRLIRVIIGFASGLELHDEFECFEGALAGKCGESGFVDGVIVGEKEVNGFSGVVDIGGLAVAGQGIDLLVFRNLVEVFTKPGGTELSKLEEDGLQEAVVVVFLRVGEEFVESGIGIVAGPGGPGMFEKFCALGGDDGGFGIEAGPVDEDQFDDGGVGIGELGVVSPELFDLGCGGFEEPEGEAGVEIGGGQFGEGSEGIGRA